jgi:hypothetical protein
VSRVGLIMHRSHIVIFGLVALLVVLPSQARPAAEAFFEQAVTGNFGGASIVARTSSDLGGAIYSLTWKKKEFLNSSDHGRELQSASSFDDLGEAYNPTEAGASRDRLHSTSAVRSLITAGNVLEGETQMAFWRGGLSEHVLRRKITIGFEGIPNVIQHLVTFIVPEKHASAVFEALTGYMPPEFSRFYSYDPATRTLSHLSDDPGEQPLPVILATENGEYAMGVYSPHPAAVRGGGYGRWRFQAERVVKWNCVYRSANILPGAYPTECYSIIGSLEDVKNAMSRLHDHFARSVQTTSNAAPGSPL